MEEVVDETFFEGESSVKKSEVEKSSESRNNAFSMRVVGSVAKYVEPVSGETSVEYLLNLFETDKTLQALPVEENGIVCGIIERKSIEQASSSAVKRFLAKDCRKYTQRVVHTLNVNDYIEKEIQTISAIYASDGIKYFPVFEKKSFFGLVSLDDLTKRTTELQNQDLEKANTIQQNLLPKKEEIDSMPYVVNMWNCMANTVGGDFYVAKQFGKSKSIFACFDVSGKNVSAALLTIAVGSFFKMLEILGVESLTPVKTTSLLDTYLAKTVPVGSFITGVIAYVDYEIRKIEIHNCGHTEVLAFVEKDRDGKKFLGGLTIKPGLPPLGMETVKAELKTPDLVKSGKISIVPIIPDLQINMYSDGLLDMQDKDGNRFDKENVTKFFKALFTKSSNEFRTLASQTVDDWVKDTPLADDITIMNVRF